MPSVVPLKLARFYSVVIKVLSQRERGRKTLNPAFVHHVLTSTASADIVVTWPEDHFWVHRRLLVLLILITADRALHFFKSFGLRWGQGFTPTIFPACFSTVIFPYSIESAKISRSPHNILLRSLSMSPVIVLSQTLGFVKSRSSVPLLLSGR